MASCATCGAAFASRNALFRHLRRDGPCRAIDDADDASTSSMGARAGVHKTSVARAFDARARGEDGPTLAYASSGRSHKKERDMTKEEVRALNERRRKRAAIRKELRARGGDSSGTAAGDPAADLWLGGLSGSAGTMKGVRQVIWHAMPHNSDLPQPQVKFIKRRGYKVNGEWKAFAFLQCRDADEARVLQAAMNEVSVTLKDGVTSVLKARPAAYKNKTNDAKAAPAAVAPPARALPPGEHPPAREIFMAWTAKDLEQRALARGMTHAALIDEAVASNEAASYVNLRGVAVDSAATQRLKDELLRSKWPARSHRRGVKSDGYIVLKRELSPNDPYAELKDACERLMRTVDETFPYDSLAITKNFISSAHLDKDDKSHQYSMSFGTFTGGGELCVESKDGKTRWMIDTRERLARFDGRSVHWVRGYSGDRFSVVWYVNRESYFTPQRYDVDETFVGVDSSSSRCVVQ